MVVIQVAWRGTYNCHVGAKPSGESRFSACEGHPRAGKPGTENRRASKLLWEGVTVSLPLPA